MAASASNASGSAFDRNAAIQWMVAGVTLILVTMPLIPIFYQAFLDKPLYYPDAALTVENFTTLFAEAEFRTVILNTIYFATMMTLVAQSIGIGCAILIGRTDLPGRRVFGEILLWPLFISHLVLAFGWFLMFGPAGYITLAVQGVIGTQPWNLYSLTGMAWWRGWRRRRWPICIASRRPVRLMPRWRTRPAARGPAPGRCCGGSPCR